MSKTSGCRVINTETLDGFSDPVLTAYAFTKSGEPCFKPNDSRAFYQLSQGLTGTVNLNHIYSTGLQLVSRNEKGVLVDGLKLEGYEAVACQLCRNGLPITGAEVEREIQRCIKSGQNNIYVFRDSWFHYLATDYGLFKDVWIFNGRPDIDLFKTDDVNKLLKSLKSPWRLYSKALANLLQKAQFQKLVSSSEL
jgi:hypothetical protein